MEKLLPDRFKETKVEFYDYDNLPPKIKYLYAPCVDTIYVNRMYPELKDRKPYDFFKENLMYIHPEDA